MPVLQGSERAGHPGVRRHRAMLMHLSHSHASPVGSPGSARLSQHFWGTLKVRRKAGGRVAVLRAQRQDGR